MLWPDMEERSAMPPLPIYKRQRFLLDFIGKISEGVHLIDLQKLVFLHTMQRFSSHYEFVPYKYGAYSFQLAEDVATLLQKGFLTESSSIITVAFKPLAIRTMAIARERGNDLIRKAYLSYPYYTINSQIINENDLFTDEEKANFINAKKGLINDEQAIITIGYEGKSVEGFINALINNDVRVLVDVRNNPFSRKFGFSKNKLVDIFKLLDIKYVHIPELGIESKYRSELSHLDNYRALFDDYKKNLAHKAGHLNGLQDILQKNSRIALMCYEKDPQMCHRHIVGDYLKSVSNLSGVDL